MDTFQVQSKDTSTRSKKMNNGNQFRSMSSDGKIFLNVTNQKGANSSSNLQNTITVKKEVIIKKEFPPKYSCSSRKRRYIKDAIENAAPQQLINVRDIKVEKEDGFKTKPCKIEYPMIIPASKIKTEPIDNVYGKDILSNDDKFDIISKTDDYKKYGNKHSDSSGQANYKLKLGPNANQMTNAELQYAYNTYPRVRDETLQKEIKQADKFIDSLVIGMKMKSSTPLWNKQLNSSSLGFKQFIKKEKP